MAAGAVSNCPSYTKAHVSNCRAEQMLWAHAVSNCPPRTKPCVSNFRALLNIYYYIAIGHPQLLTLVGGAPPNTRLVIGV